MEPNSGIVDTLTNWQADFEAMLANTTADERAIAVEPELFEDLELIAVVPNLPNEAGFDSHYGEWRPAN